MRKLLLLTVVLLIAAFPLLADDPLPDRPGRAELRFLEGMIDHHQMALDMAADCLTTAEDASLHALCQNIIDAQSAEIVTMQGWLLDWYNVEYTPVSMVSPQDDGMDHSGHAMGDAPATDPAMTMGMMAGLNCLTGRDYDIAWTEAMIDHHDDALHMSERILQYEVHPELGDLANAIIEAQTAEIALMEDMLVTLANG